MNYNYSSEETRKQAQALKELLGSKKGSSSGGGENKDIWFSFPSGTEKITVRVLPIFWEGAYMMIYRHNDLPGDKKNYLCMQTHGMHCPICEAIGKFEGKMDMKPWKANCKVYLNGLFVRATDDKGNLITHMNRDKQPYQIKKPYLLPLSQNLFEWIVDSLTDPEKGDVVHPIQGRNITLQRESFNGKFKREFAFGSTPIADTEDEVKGILASMTKPGDIWRSPDDEFFKKAKEIAALLEQTLSHKLNELMGGMGGMGNPSMPPRATGPTPAQMLGNPAFNQPPLMAAPQAPYVPPMQPSFTPPPVAQPAYTPPPAQAYAPPPAAPAYNPGVPATTAPPMAPPQAAPQAAPASGPVKAAVPAGAPGCFSDAGVFNRESNKCMVCNYDYHCERAIIAARTT